MMPRTLTELRRATGLGMVAATLLTALSPQTTLAGAAEDEKARGWAMANKAGEDFRTAIRLYKDATNRVHVAEVERKVAAAKIDEARKLRRQAFILIGDANKLQASDYRDRAFAISRRAETEEADIARLRLAVEHEKLSAADDSQSISSLRDAAKNETNPTHRAELTTMADTLAKESATAAAEIAQLEKRITASQMEVDRLNKTAARLNEVADKLDPEKKTAASDK